MNYRQLLGDEAVFFSILREPLAQFVSSWDFYDTRHFGFETLTDLIAGRNNGNGTKESDEDFQARRR